ncbi:unnamed protein product, partial [Heterosigma akashiwo]
MDPFADFFGDSFFNNDIHPRIHQQQQSSRRGMQAGSMPSDPFFGGPFGAMGMGGMMNMGNSLMGNGMGGGTFSMQSSSFMSSGGQGGGRSERVTQHIGPDGVRVTRREVTQVGPDGRPHTTVEESVDEVPLRRGGGGGGGLL